MESIETSDTRDIEDEESKEVKYFVTTTPEPKLITTTPEPVAPELEVQSFLNIFETTPTPTISQIDDEFTPKKVASINTNFRKRTDHFIKRGHIGNIE